MPGLYMPSLGNNGNSQTMKLLAGLQGLSAEEKAFARDMLKMGADDTLARIKRAAARAEAANPMNRPTATGVTLTVENAADPALTRIYSGLAGGTPLTAVPLSQVSIGTGGAMQPDINGRIIFPVANVANNAGAVAVNGNLGAVLPADKKGWNGWGWEWHTRGAMAKMQIRMVGYVTHAFRIRIGGRYIAVNPTAFASDGSANYITLVFDTTESRNIVLEGMQNDSIVSVHVAPGTILSKPRKALDRVLALLASDSIGEGTGCQYPGLQAWFKILSRMMGWADARQMGVGSTGWFSDNGGNRKIINDQMNDWDVVNSDISLSDVDLTFLSAGVNDSARAVRQQWIDRVASGVQRARGRTPNSIVVVTGTHAAVTGPSAVYTDIEGWIREGFNAANDSRSLFIPFATDPNGPVIQGTGDSGAPNGTGNSDIATNPDKLHLVAAGNTIIAGHVENHLRDYLNMAA